MLVRRIARPLMSTIFVVGGVEALRNPTGKAKAAAPLIEQSKDALPDEVVANVPDDPETLVRINGGIQVAGGILLATGKAPRIASLALAGSLVPTTLAGHSFWNETDPEVKAAQRIHFFKNLSLLGGLLIAAVDTEGKPSVAWRSRRAARRAQESVVAALPGHGTPDAGERVKEIASIAATRSSEIAEAAQPKLAKLADLATEKGTEFAEVASPALNRWAHIAADKGSELAEEAHKRGSKLAELAADRGGDFAEEAQKRGSKLAGVAADRGSELAEVAQKRGYKLATMANEKGSALADEAQKRGAAWADLASDQAGTLGKRARKRAEKQSKELDKATAQARAKLEKQVAKAQKNLDNKLQQYTK